MTGERPFPLASVSSEEQMRMQRPIPTEEYTARIAPRLIARERTDPEPKVMPDVLAVWGLAPRSAASFLPTHEALRGHPSSPLPVRAGQSEIDRSAPPPGAEFALATGQ